MNCLVNIDGFTSFYLALYVTKRVIEREQSIMGTIFFIFKVNTVEKVLRLVPSLEKINIGNTGNQNHPDLEVRVVLVTCISKIDF